MIAFIFIIISLSYSFFILWLTEGMKKSSNHPNSQKISLPEISIIVSARNEELNLPVLIKSLVSQNYPKDLLKIIIVNDRSTDNTHKILKKFKDQYNNVKIITITETPDNWAPKKWALNSAVKESNTDIILQTDADCVPNKNWVTTAVQYFSKPSVGFISGPAPLTIDNNTLLNSLFKLDSLSQDAFSAGGFSRGLVFSCTGRNMGFLKQAFEDVGGYSNISNFISGDDDLLLQKIANHPIYKAKFMFSKNAMVESPPPDSIMQFINQRLRFSSKGFSYYSIQASSALKIVLPFLYITNLVILLSLSKFIETNQFLWIFPWLIKLLTDIVFTYMFYHIIEQKWSLLTTILLSVLHPIYIVFFGIAGPLSSFDWKKDD